MNLEVNFYNPHVLFWLNVFAGTYTSTSPVCVFFLVLDRCFALKFPHKYKANEKTLFLTISYVAIVLAAAFNVTFFLLELPLDSEIGRLFYLSTLNNFESSEFL
uniref:G-protein coupled receptors family 1 profile domain-containing protein n=1 Tax=Ditylenchus dipsaci TaxID=166011 RepID=A0A915D7V3_9BILA